MKLILLAYTFLLFLNVQSQEFFKKGYLINNNNERVECLINDARWKSSSDRFEYMLSESDQIIKGDISTVKEFGVYDFSKYIRQIVNIDISENADKEVILEKREVFLKILIEGKASLYLYEAKRGRKFFFKKDNSSIEQLIYKRYKVSDFQITESNEFRKQLYASLACQGVSQNIFDKLTYDRKDLMSLFSNYNKCQNSSFVKYNAKKERDVIKISIRPRLNRSSLSMENFNEAVAGANYRKLDFGSKFRFSTGIEAEYVLPFGRDRWTFTIEPTYQSFKGYDEMERPSSLGGSIPTTVSYQSVEFPVGLRHYFLLKNASKLFLNVAYLFDISYNSNVTFENTASRDLKIKTTPNVALGIGYKYDRYSFELNYRVQREVLADNLFWRSRYNTLSFIVGFSIFN